MIKSTFHRSIENHQFSTPMETTFYNLDVGWMLQGVKQNVLCMRDLKNYPVFISSTLPD